MELFEVVLHVFCIRFFLLCRLLLLLLLCLVMLHFSTTCPITDTQVGGVCGKAADNSPDNTCYPYYPRVDERQPSGENDKQYAYGCQSPVDYRFDQIFTLFKLLRHGIIDFSEMTGIMYFPFYYFPIFLFNIYVNLSSILLFIETTQFPWRFLVFQQQADNLECRFTVIRITMPYTSTHDETSPVFLP